jgi:hypothetical protein
MASDNQWTWLRPGAERIGGSKLQRAWREGALRGVPSHVIAREALRIGAGELQHAWLDGTLPLRGVKRLTREVVEIPRAEAGRLVLDCGSNCLVRLSSQGRRRLLEYHSMQAQTAAVERLARKARAQRKRPKPTRRDQQNRAAQVEAARARREKEAERARVGAERAREAERTWRAEAEHRAREAERETEGAERADEQRASEAETPKPARKRAVGRPPGQPGVAVADARKLDEFAARYPDDDEKQQLQRLKDGLQGTMTKRSVARRVRAARAQRDADKESQKT